MTYDPNNPQQKRGMSTGKKVALGCGVPVLLALVFIGGCTALVGGAANEVDKAVKADEADDQRAAKEDVKITVCKIKNEEFVGRSVTSRVSIVNHGDKRANYVVEGEFLDDKGNKVGELLATVENLKPGTSTSQDFGGIFTDADLKGVKQGSCALVKVTRDEWSAAN